MTKQAHLEKRPINQRVLASVKKYSEFFADLSTQIYELKKFKCSEVGLACILCARKITNITPVWNNNLKDLTLTCY